MMYHVIQYDNGESYEDHHVYPLAIVAYDPSETVQSLNLWLCDLRRALNAVDDKYNEMLQEEKRKGAFARWRAIDDKCHRAKIRVLAKYKKTCPHPKIVREALWWKPKEFTHYYVEHGSFTYVTLPVIRECGGD